jgi:hypothetical protein
MFVLFRKFGDNMRIHFPKESCAHKTINNGHEDPFSNLIMGDK